MDFCPRSIFTCSVTVWGVLVVPDRNPTVLFLANFENGKENLLKQQARSQKSTAEKSTVQKMPKNQGRKNHDSHRRDRIWRDFLHWIFRYFLQILGGLSY